jgi:hypothetical protein
MIYSELEDAKRGFYHSANEEERKVLSEIYDRVYFYQEKIDDKWAFFCTIYRNIYLATKDKSKFDFEELYRSIKYRYNESHKIIAILEHYDHEPERKFNYEAIYIMKESQEIIDIINQ